MKLHQIPRGSKIRLPVAREGILEIVDQLCTVNVIDETSAQVTTPDGLTVVLSANSDVLPWDGHYELVTANGL